jgi:hypothetical protein
VPAPGVQASFPPSSVPTSDGLAGGALLGAHNTPVWALEPPPVHSFVSASRNPNPALSDGQAPALSSPSSWVSSAPSDGSSSVLSTNAPVSALDALVLVDHFLRTEANSGALGGSTASGRDDTVVSSPPSFLSCAGSGPVTPPAPMPTGTPPQSPSLSGGALISEGQAALPPVAQRHDLLAIGEQPPSSTPPSAAQAVTPACPSSFQPAPPAPSDVGGGARIPWTPSFPATRPLVPSFPSAVGGGVPAASAAQALPQSPATHSNAEVAPVPTPPPPPPHRLVSKPPRLVLTAQAAEKMPSLHMGDEEILQPLEERSLATLVEELQRAAQDRFGLPLSRDTATTALEVSRHQSDASGWPSVDEALSCLRPHPAPSVVLPPTSASDSAAAPLSVVVPVSTSNRPTERPPPVTPAVYASRAPAADPSQFSGLSIDALLRLQMQQQQEAFRLRMSVPWLSQPTAPTPPGQFPPPASAVQPPSQLLSSSHPTISNGHGAFSSPVPPPLPQTVNIRQPPPLPVPPPFPPNPGVSSSARFRRRADGRAEGPITAPAPAPRDRCTSCGHRGHDSLQCPEGLDVSSVVDAAEHLEAAVRE